MDTKKIMMISVPIIIIGSLVGVTFFQMTVNSEVQKNIDKAVIEIESISIEDFTDTSVDLTVNLLINNPSGISAEIKNTSLEIKYDNQYLGEVNVPSSKLGSNSTKMTLSQTLVIEDENKDTFNSLVCDFITEETISISVSGSITVTAPALFIKAQSTAVLNKTLQINGLNGLKNISIEKLSLLNTTEDSLNIEASVTIENPSQISFVLKDLVFDLNYSGYNIGNFSLAELSLTQGLNELKVQANIKPSNTTVMQEIVSNFLNGKNTTITVQCGYGIDGPTLLTPIMTQISFTTTLIGEGNIQLTLNEIKITEITEEKITVWANITIENPTIVEGELGNVLLDVFYQNDKVGTIAIEDVELITGENVITSSFDLIPENLSILAELATNYLDGEIISLTLQGSQSGNTLSQLLSGWSTTVTIQTIESFGLEVKEIGIINSTDTTLNLQLTVDLNNPTDASLDLTNATFEIWWTKYNVYLGDAVLPDTHIVGGSNLLETVVTLSPSNSSVIAELVDDYLSGSNITIQVKGKSSQGNLINDLISSLIIEFDLPGIAPADIAIISLVLTNASSNAVDLNVTILIKNPTSSALDLDNVTFDLFYESQFLGNLTLTNLTIQPGSSEYEVALHALVSNQTLITELISDYLNDKTVEINVTGTASGGNMLSTILQNYQNMIVLPNLDLNFSLESFDITNSSASTLDLELNITLNNPTDLEFTIDSLNVSIYYQGYKIGNVTSNPITLTPGLNHITLLGVLSSQDNKANLESFLSSYIKGETTTIIVNGSLYSNFSDILTGSTEIPINVSVPIIGIQTDLIQGIEVTMISISLSPIGVTISAEATIQNPMNFDIEIITISYSLYFDDPDGAYFFPTSYPAKNNIFITTLSEDYSSSPLALATNTSDTISDSFTTANTELVVRLYDEYETNSRLKVDILSGSLTIKIGEFEITINFEFFDVPVD
ncbi:MAG: DUF3712 domain-containing protein [Candidatus Hodarchaeales archaeon]